MTRTATHEDGFDERLRRVREYSLTGLSYVTPLVVVGGVLVGLESVLEARLAGEWAVVLEALFSDVGSLALELALPVFGAFIAYAIADRPGLAPGFVLSYAVQEPELVALVARSFGVELDGATGGFIGALAVGLLAGYVARAMGTLSYPSSVRLLVPIVLVPVGTTILLLPVALVIAVPSALAVAALVELVRVGGAVAVLVGVTIGAMMAVDMGGPVNKIAYLVAIGLVVEGVYVPMAAAMVAGMTPPLGLALATYLSRGGNSSETHELATGAALNGLVFVTEGAIPLVERDRARLLPVVVAGSAGAGALACWLAVTMPAPHGGVFAFVLSNAPLALLGCLCFGTVITAVGTLAVRPTFEPAEHTGVHR